MHQFKKFMRTPTIRLALSYLAIIMLMSVCFSVVFYNASSQQLGRQLPPSSLFDDNPKSGERLQHPRVDAFLEQRIAEGRTILLGRLMMLNALILVVGAGLSYYLARQTLRPIEATMESQSQFVSDASHELRTPLTAMQTMNEVALRRSKLTASDTREILGQNIEEVQKLQALTDGLLKLAHQEGTTIPGTAVSLQDIASDAMNRVIELAQAKNITVSDSVGVTKVLSDRQALIQMIVILLENAIKYSQPDSTVYLTSSSKGKFGYLHVRDEGPGIRPYDQRRIFDRFYRADQSRNKQLVAGHGIGLALAKKIAGQIGADITVDSSVGNGSMFSLKVPLA
jgi:two-component system sensor histidine kinase CiaH